MVLSPILRSIQRKILRPIFAAAQRILITADPVLETNFTFQNTKTFPDDFDLSIDAILPTAATTVTLYGQVASADHYIKVLSTGFVSINIDTSIVTSTVLATKDSKQRRYGVRVVGDDFIFTEEGATIDTVTDAVAAAKSLIINVIAQSNGADFFDGTLSDPILNDLTTASNSVSWQLNRASPATTEQSSSGNNILTYNNAPASTRELLTFINGRWVGVTVVVNGLFVTDTDWNKSAGWTISGGLANADLTAEFRNLSQFNILTSGYNYETLVKTTIHAAGSVFLNLGVGADGSTAINSVGTFTEDITATGENLTVFNSAFPVQLSITEISLKRFIEVA